MGRPSKLSPEQWSEVERRLAEGEPRRALAREFGVDESAIRARVSTQTPRIKAAAQKVVEAREALAELPVSQQYTALSLADKLRSISGSLAAAAELGAKTSHRLHSLANSEVAKVDDAEPMKQLDNLRNVGVLTKLANESAHVALNLLAANKDRVKQLDDDAAGIGGPAVPVFNIMMTKG
jgi:hypothetical protein